MFALTAALARIPALSVLPLPLNNLPAARNNTFLNDTFLNDTFPEQNITERRSDSRMTEFVPPFDLSPDGRFHHA